MTRISVAFNLLLFAFRYFNAILSTCVSFLFLLVFVQLVERKGPRCSNDEFDSGATHARMTLLQERACTSSISVDDLDDCFGSRLS